MSPPSAAGLVVVGRANSRPAQRKATVGAADTAQSQGARPQSARQTRPTRPQSARQARPQSARQARTFMQPPPVCDVLDGLWVSSGAPPHSAGPERHRQHGNADDVWVVETPDQLRARPPSAPTQTRRGRARRPVRVVRHVHPRTVELAIGSASTRAQNNALRTTAVVMAMRRRCAGVLAPAPCSNRPVTWRCDYKLSAGDVASAVETVQDAVDSARGHRAGQPVLATRAAKQLKPGPAGFGSRSTTTSQSRKPAVHPASQTGLAGRAFIALRRPVEDGKPAQAEQASAQ